MKIRAGKEADVLKAVFTTQETERTRIAEDLHDNIGSKLTAFKLNNQLVEKEVISEQGKNLSESNTKIVQTIINDIRIIVRNQSSHYIADYGLIHEMELIQKQFTQLHHINIQINHNLQERIKNNEFELSIFRILQELLNNSIKHANCSEIRIQIHLESNRLTVSYADNGIGLRSNTEKKDGMGLRNIEARIKLFHGLSSVFSEFGKGTNYVITYELNNIEMQ